MIQRSKEVRQFNTEGKRVTWSQFLYGNWIKEMKWKEMPEGQFTNPCMVKNVSSKVVREQ